jgi:hypothetical protein
MAKKAARSPYVGNNKRRKWQSLCAECQHLFNEEDTVVDHIEPCGPVSSWEEAAEFMRRLLVETDGMQVLCRQCHEGKREQDRETITQYRKAPQ